MFLIRRLVKSLQQFDDAEFPMVIKLQKLSHHLETIYQVQFCPTGLSGASGPDLPAHLTIR